jgi:putative transposase
LRENRTLCAIRKVEAGTPPADDCRQLRCGEPSFYLWKKRYLNLSLTEL